jgi:hypothetical protein
LSAVSSLCGVRFGLPKRAAGLALLNFAGWLKFGGEAADTNREDERLRRRQRLQWLKSFG